MKAAGLDRFKQEQLLPFLLNPNSYPHRPRRVQLLQTHASFVFLAPPFVYKVKKSVNFGFLDFSTLAKRRFYCGREVQLNRRLCSKVYLGVIPISLKTGRLTFGKGSQIVEYAVKMQELAERYFLNKLIERDAVEVADLDRIAQKLKKFYQAQRPTAAIEEWGKVKRLKISTDENFRQTEAYVGQTISRASFEAIRFYTHEFYRRNAALFASRIQERRIRDCHGDLHLEHIHLAPRSLHIYDCIEFNDRLRYVDVASDVAFLAMDLDYEGRPDLARHFVAKMGAALRDHGMAKLMDFYKCYRANVRGKVESLRSSAPEASAAEQRMSAERARRYFRLALQYPVAGSEPMVLVVMGRIASGKSTLAGELARELGWEAFSSDCVRKKLAGLPVHKRSDKAARARLYSPTMTQKTYQALCRYAAKCVKQHRSVILDGRFGRRAYRDEVKGLCERLGANGRFITVEASDAMIKRRLKERDAKVDEVSDARFEDFDKLRRLDEPPSELGSSELLVATTENSPEATLIEVLKKLVRLQFERIV
jgi:aminoglycoside phosphotransferase family enzyme/predicted kinase